MHSQPAQRLSTDEATLQLLVQSGSVPRAINILGLTALYNSAAPSEDPVELDVVVAAAKELAR